MEVPNRFLGSLLACKRLGISVALDLASYCGLNSGDDRNMLMFCVLTPLQQPAARQATGRPEYISGDDELAICVPLLVRS